MKLRKGSGGIGTRDTRTPGHAKFRSGLLQFQTVAYKRFGRHQDMGHQDTEDTPSLAAKKNSREPPAPAEQQKLAPSPEEVCEHLRAQRLHSSCEAAIAVEAPRPGRSS